MALKPNQIQAVELLARGKTLIKDIAKECNVSEQTIYTWKKEKEFNDEVQLLANRLFKQYLPCVQSTLIKKAIAGDLKAISEFMDRIEYIEKLDKNAPDYNISFNWNIPTEDLEKPPEDGCPSI